MPPRKRKRGGEEEVYSIGNMPTKQLKLAISDASVPEKRGAIFKKRCPKIIWERVERVMSQRQVAISSITRCVTAIYLGSSWSRDRERGTSLGNGSVCSVLPGMSVPSSIRFGDKY